MVTVFLNGAYSEEVAHRYPGECVFAQLNHKKPWWRILAVTMLFRLCKQHRFSIVVSHHYKPSSIMAFVDRLYPLNRLFMINHNPNNLRRKARILMIKHLFSRRWTYVGVSEWIKRDFLEKAGFLSPDRMHVLYNCIDIDTIRSNQFSRADAREKLNIPADTFVFGNIHRLDKSKGHDYLIRAFAKVAAEMPTAILVIIGGGDRKSLLEHIAMESGVADRVVLAGVIHNASHYTKAFDVFVSPSLHEGFGLGLLEGMAAAIPTLTSTGGASPEVVGQTGLKFPPGDADALARNMQHIYDISESDREAMGQASLERLRQNFSREIYHRNVVKLFTH